MRRAVWIFLAAILLPSLGLAWLAIRSVRDQQVLLEHQEAIICQNQADALAQSIQQEMDNVRLDFVATAQRLQQESASPQDLARSFDPRLREAWPLAETGFSVGLNGEIYSPASPVDARTRQFRNDNDRFLSNRENAEVYFFNKAGGNNLTQNNSAPLGGAVTLADDQAKTLNYRGSLTSDQLRPLAQTSAPVTATTPALADATGKDSLLEKQNEVPPPAAKPAANLNRDGFVAADKNSSDLKADNDQQETASQKPMAKEEEAKSKTVRDKNATRSAASAANSADTPASAATAKKASKAQSDSASLDSSTLDIGGSAATGTATPATTAPVNAPAAPPAAAELSSGSGGLPAPVASPAPIAATGSVSPPADEASAPPGNAHAEPAPTLDKVSRFLPLSQNGLQQSQGQKITRNVVPQQKFDSESVSLSNTLPAESDFRQIVGNETSGELARFLDNKLCLLVWSHVSPDAPIIFGAQLSQPRLLERLRDALARNAAARDVFSSSSSNYCLALLDDTGHPVALSRPGFKADWKHPFVATEIGETLPHWEAALYLVDPQQITRTARTLRYTLALIVVVLVAAILAGGSVIAADIRRQVRLAQQKTDFVSNVSHELKTPLTSIRMFADLLAEKRVPDEARQAAYLRIIAAEAARLTRLINNVLDFARMERGKPPGEHQPCDLVDAVRDVIETCQPHLETAGVAFRSEIETDSLPLSGDRDALAQIILNLVSNAEKYGGSDITVRVRRQETSSGPLGCVDVLDHGPGISPRDMKTIFEPFHRLDDSLASGVPGSGLGLTLARRMARAHHGDVACSARAGGGTCFTLSVPLTPASTPKTS